MDYNKAIEAFAAGFSVTEHIERLENPSDIITKPVSPSEFYKYTSTIIFGIISKYEK